MALRWCIDHGDATPGFRICRAHWNLWVGQGAFTEGRAWLTQLAALPSAGSEPIARVIGQTLESSLAFRQGSYAQALQLQKDALPVLRQADDPWPLHVALTDIGWISIRVGDYATAQTHLDERW